MQDLSFCISFADAQKRYDIKHPALSYRIKALGLQTKRKGRNTYLTLKQISLLDDLNRFLSDYPNKTIDEFMYQQKLNTQSKSENLTISSELKSDESLNCSTNTDVSLTSHFVTDESLTAYTIPQIQTQITHILKAISRVEGLVTVTDESSLNDADRGKIIEADSRIIELEERINKLNEKLNQANQRYDLLLETNKELLQLSKHIFKTSSDREIENTHLKKFCKALMPFEKTNLFDNLIRIDNSVYLKTNYTDFDLFANAFCKWM